MCGPLAVAACSGPQGVSGRSVLSYGAGRLGMYGVTGAIAGAAGAAVGRWLGGDLARSAVALAVGASLALSALRLLRSGAATRPALVTLGRRPAALRSAGLGALTGVLPCGALAAGWMLSASTASGLWGAVAMMVFALASAPGLGAALLVGKLVAKGVGRRGRVLAAAGLLLAGVWVAARPWTMRSPACHCHEHTAAMRRL